ncbi:MAG TPA: hypothetical protein VN598_15485 [Usitatibacter sp.]|nr:hypothetical protein [Usitatibacter sp.]
MQGQRMNTFFWLVAGGLLGWIGYSVVGLNETIGKMAAMILGAMAGVLGGKVVAPLLVGNPLVAGAFSGSALFFAMATAAVILGASHMVMARWWR